MAKSTFIFSFDWADALRDYPDDIRLAVYEAIIAYARTGTVPEMQPLARMAFDFVKQQINRNAERYDAMVAARSEAGKKGMASRWGHNDNKDNTVTDVITNVTNVTSDNKDNTVMDVITKITKDNKNNKHNSYDNDNDINLDVNILSPPYNPPLLNEGGSRLKDSPASKIREYYNAEIVTKGAKLCKSVALTARRKSLIEGRIDEHGVEKVKEVVDKAIASRFLNYDASNAPVDLEWIMRPNNFVKVLEGRYDNKSHSGGSRTASDPRNNKNVNDRWQS